MSPAWNRVFWVGSYLPGDEAQHAHRRGRSTHTGRQSTNSQNNVWIPGNALIARIWDSGYTPASCWVHPLQTRATETTRCCVESSSLSHSSTTFQRKGMGRTTAPVSLSDCPSIAFLTFAETQDFTTVAPLRSEHPMLRRCLSGDGIWGCRRIGRFVHH